MKGGIEEVHEAYRIKSIIRVIIFVIPLFTICCISMSGCRHIYVGGSGEVGGVHGSGGVTIPVPKKD